ncbi:hypothetical protein [Streptomyces fulvorobeus]|uniref:Uncharacterized protein n=1 Tax=Streptomyces fulvorobeus TaxID=284028 RepID=A0A7J0C7U1_9ACTN|nr:hypothetical protein [Streptomyces fulvorobeus]NYE42148.1 hypothetical protein [Streptomyces fulvorobeus]GFM98529.1 hypothetical protein Sfulv_33400 [Streptomyces fulvorobeus]
MGTIIGRGPLGEHTAVREGRAEPRPKDGKLRGVPLLTKRFIFTGPRGGDVC